MPAAQIEVTSRGEKRVARGFRDIDRSVQRVGATSRRTTSTMAAGWGKVRRSLGGVGTAMGAVGLIAAGKRVLDFRQKLGQLQAKMKIATPEAERMGKEVLDVGKAHNIAKDEVLGALQVFQDFGGYVGEGRKMLPQLGKRAAAATVDIKDLATVSAALIDTGLSPDQAIKAIDLLIDQADAGTVSMADMAAVFPEVAKGGAAMGERFKGLAGASRLGKMMQVAGSVFAGNAQMSRTAVKALFRDLTANAAKIEKKYKVKVFDEKGLRDTDALMAEILKKTGGDIQKLSKIFTADSLTMVSAYSGAYDQASGKFKGVVSKVGARKGGAENIEKMYALRMGGVAAEAEKVKAAMLGLEAALMQTGGSMIKWANENRGKAVAAGVGAVAAVKLGPTLVKGLFGLLTRGKGGGAGAALAGLPGGGVQPVFVVNMPGANLGQAAGYFGQGGGGLGGAGAAGGGGNLFTRSMGSGFLDAPTKLGKVGQAAGAAGAAIGALMVGYEVGTMLDNWLDMSGKMSNFFAGSQKERIAEGQKRAAGHNVATAGGAALQDAKRLAVLAGRGLKSVQVRGAGGKAERVQLNQASMLEYLKKKAMTDRGLTEAQWNKIAASVAAAISKAPIVVRPAGGLEEPDAQRGRGGKQ